MQLVSGAQVGVYVLEERLGRGGMAEVWAATHAILGARVALKILRHSSPALQDRLLREGRVQASIEHPNILPVRDVIDVDGRPGLVLPLVRGPSLAHFLRQHRPTEAEAIAIFRAVVEGVGYAHGHGLIHRDLKPGNILLEEHQDRVIPRVADFGIVKSIEEHSDTHTGALMGTLGYAAPEQLLDAAHVDQRADLFSLGVVLVELLTGALPYQWRSLWELIQAYQEGPALDAVPPRWHSLCRALLAADPEKRLSDCEALAERLTVINKPQGNDPLARAALRRAVRLPPAAPVPHRRAPDGPAEETVFSEWLAQPVPALPPNNLPPPRDGFVGRRNELADLTALLDTARLVSIIGSAGIGKTRLALQLARRELSRYPGGIYFCDLSEARSLEGILFVVGQALEMAPGWSDPVGQIGHAIAGRGKVLLIMDNVEQIASQAAETVSNWASRAPSARFVLTSRAGLSLSHGTALELEVLSPDDAAALFFSRTPTPSSLPDEQSRADVATLLELLDRLPLAIELAAARASVMSARDMITRMAQRRRLLSGTEHQDALWSTIGWSWELLSRPEKAAFAQCSLFEGGFTLTAAEAVLEPPTDAPWPADLIQALVAQSLLRALPENRLGEARFGMLLSLQAFAREKLRSQPDAMARGQHRHATHYATLGTRSAIGALIGTGGVMRWWALAVELDNLVAAHRWATDTKKPDLAVPLVRGIFSVARQQELHIALPALQAVLALPRLNAQPLQKANVLHMLGTLYENQSQPAAGEQYLLEALVMFREAGADAHAGVTLGNLGNAYVAMGRTKDAEACYQEAIALHRGCGARAQEAIAMGSYALLLQATGRTKDAEASYQEAIAIHRKVGDRRHEGLMLSNLGTLCRLLSRNTEAEAHYRQSLAIHRAVGDRRHEAAVLGNLAIVRRDQGRPAEALLLYRHALSAGQKIGLRHNEGVVLGNLGNLLQQQGQPAEAAVCYTQAAAIHEECGLPRFAAIVRSNLGSLYHNQGQLDEAETLYRRTLAVFREVGDVGFEAFVTGNLGSLLRERGALGPAETNLRRALHLHRTLGDRRFEAYTQKELGDLLCERGELDAAEACLREALATIQAVGEPNIEGIVLGSIGALLAKRGSQPESTHAFQRGEALLRAAGDQIHLADLLCQRADTALRAQQPKEATSAIDEARRIAEQLGTNREARLSQQIRSLAEQLALSERTQSSPNNAT